MKFVLIVYEFFGTRTGSQLFNFFAKKFMKKIKHPEPFFYYLYLLSMKTKPV